MLTQLVAVAVIAAVAAIVSVAECSSNAKKPAETKSIKFVSSGFFVRFGPVRTVIQPFIDVGQLNQFTAGRLLRLVVP